MDADIVDGILPRGRQRKACASVGVNEARQVNALRHAEVGVDSVVADELLLITNVG